MSRTVVGLFRTPAEAQQVKRQLVGEGFPAESIRVLSNESDGFAEGAVADATSSASRDAGVMGSLKNFFHSLTGSDANEQDYYTRGVSAGGALLAVTVAEERTEAVVSLLEASGAADVTEEGASASGTQTNARAISAESINVPEPGEAIPVIEEKLQVGKRQVQRGGVRVYSQLVETPVEEKVRLRDEHVTVQRTPVNRPISAAQSDAFKDETIEMTEMAEEAVVAKQARVVEEVRVGKDVTERAQTVKDKLRHTEVNVEEIPGEISRKGKTAGNS